MTWSEAKHMPFWKRRLVEPIPEGSQRNAYDECTKRVAALEIECKQLREQLTQSELTLRERTERLYATQQEHSTEHYGLAESTRLLKIERLRNAGAYAQRDVILERARSIQERIRFLKDHLRLYEPVDDLYFDDAEIIHEDS